MNKIYINLYLHSFIIIFFWDLKRKEKENERGGWSSKGRLELRKERLELIDGEVGPY